ncbi:unnamed protein product [Mortierella alpina]
MDAATSPVIVEGPAPHSLADKTRPTCLRDSEPTLRRQSTNDLRRGLASISATGQHAAASSTARRTRTRLPLLSKTTTKPTPRAEPQLPSTRFQQPRNAAFTPTRSTTSSRSLHSHQPCHGALFDHGSMPLPHSQPDRQHLPLQDCTTAPVHPSIPSAPLSARIRSDSSSSTSTTSVTYLRSAAEAVIANAHQTHFQQPYPSLNDGNSHPSWAGNWTRAHTQSRAAAAAAAATASDGSSLSFSSAHSSPSSRSVDIRLDSYNIDPTRGIRRTGQQSHGSAQGFDSTTTIPPFPELGQQESALSWHQQQQQQDDDDDDESALQSNDRRTLHHASQSLISLNPVQHHHHTPRIVNAGMEQWQRRTILRAEDASTITDNTPGGSWVSDLNADEKGIAQRQHHIHLRHSSSAALGATSRTGRQPANTQESEDREVYRVFRGRLKAHSLGRNHHKKWTGPLQVTYVASRGGYDDRASDPSHPHHASRKEHPREHAQSQQQQDHERYPLTDRHGKNGRRFCAYPQLDVQHEEPPRDGRDRIREQELWTIIARLEQQVADLNDANDDLQSSLHDSDKRVDRLIMEQDAKLLQLKEEHDRSVLDTKHRTKRLFDQVMRKQRLDEGKRLATVFKELQSVQSENTDLHARIQTLQETTLAVVQDSNEDASALGAFWDQVLLPSVRAGVPRFAQDTVTAPVQSSSPKRGKDSLWDVVQGQGQTRGRLGVSKATLGCSKINAVAGTVTKSAEAEAEADGDGDADADADSDNGRGVSRGLGSHAYKTPLGQQCWALLQHIMTALVEPHESRNHGCTCPSVRFKYTGQERDRFADRRQQRKRYSDSSASSGKTIVAAHSRQPSHADGPAGSLSDCATVLRHDPVKYFGELRAEHQREIERIKAQCVSVYRESLQDVRTEMLAKMRSKIRVGV